MDSIVENAKEDSNGGLGNVGMPAVQQDAHVMVPVQKDDRFLVYNEKERVEEFTERIRYRQVDRESDRTM